MEDLDDFHLGTFEDRFKIVKDVFAEHLAESYLELTLKI